MSAEIPAAPLRIRESVVRATCSFFAAAVTSISPSASRRIYPGCGGLCILAIVCFSSRVPQPSQFSFYPQTMGAPGPSLLGTWDSKNLDSPELFFRPSSKARIVLSQVRKSRPWTPGTHLGLNSSQDALKNTRYGMLRAA